jgi:hypothetical protein
MPLIKKKKKVKTLADRFISEFKLVKDKEYIRFKDGPSTLTETINKASKELGLKYGGKKTQSETHLVHYASFVKNPLRYIEEMINETEASKAIKAKRIETVHELVRQAMEEDPLTTVRSIVMSLARVARF